MDTWIQGWTREYRDGHGYRDGHVDTVPWAQGCKDTWIQGWTHGYRSMDTGMPDLWAHGMSDIHGHRDVGTHGYRSMSTGMGIWIQG